MFCYCSSSPVQSLSLSLSLAKRLVGVLLSYCLSSPVPVTVASKSHPSLAPHGRRPSRAARRHTRPVLSCRARGFSATFSACTSRERTQLAPQGQRPSRAAQRPTRPGLTLHARGCSATFSAFTPRERTHLAPHGRRPSRAARSSTRPGLWCCVRGRLVPSGAHAACASRAAVITRSPASHTAGARAPRPRVSGVPQRGHLQSAHAAYAARTPHAVDPIPPTEGGGVKKILRPAVNRVLSAPCKGAWISELQERLPCSSRRCVCEELFSRVRRLDWTT